MRRSAPLLSVLLLAPALLAGCGTDADAEPAASSSAEPAGSVTDATGADVAVLPDDARVVDAGFLSLSLAGLGIAPVGVGYPASTLGLITPFLTTDEADLLTGDPVVSDSFEIDPEQLLGLAPDVVLTTTTYADVFGTALDALPDDVPVFVLDDTDPDSTWQDRTRTLGELLSVGDRADALVAEVEADTDELAADVADAGATGTVVSVIRAGAAEGGSGDFEAYVPPSLPSQLIAEVGLRQPAAQESPGELLPGAAQFARVGVSLENLPAHDGDALVSLTVAGLTDDSAVTGSSLWTGLRAVQAGRVTEAPYLLWTTGSAIGVRQIVADLRTAVLG